MFGGFYLASQQQQHRSSSTGHHSALPAVLPTLPKATVLAAPRCPCAARRSWDRLCERSNKQRAQQQGKGTGMFAVGYQSKKDG